MKRIIFGIMLILILIGVLTLISNIRQVESVSEVLFFDDFDDGIADGWIPQRGHIWEVIDGQYVSSLPSGRAISIVDNLTFTDGIIKVAVRHGGGNPFQDGIVFRYTDDQHYYSFFISDEYDEVRLRIHNETDSHYGISIIDWAKYPTTERPGHGGGVSYPINPDTVYILEIRIHGNNFTGYVNGEKILSGIDDDFKVGSVGLSAHRGEVFFDNFTLLSYPPLTVSISPTSASILVGQSVTFTSTVSGGYTPYIYRWFLNGNPVSGATSDTWTFTPTEAGIYYVYLKVTDAEGNTAQSDTAREAVAAVPVGGYSIPINVPMTTTKPVTPYVALLAILTAILITIKRERKRKH